MKIRIVGFLESIIGILGNRVWFIGWILLYLPLWLICRTSGKENLAKRSDEGLIVVANHLSYTDVPIIATLFPPGMPVSFLGKKELMDTPVLGALCKNGFMIPVDRDRKISAVNLRAFRQALSVLKKGGMIGIFMQGGIGGSDVKRSPIELARRTGASILPIGFIQHVWFHFNGWGGIDIGPYRVVIGKKLKWQDLGIEDSDILAERLWQKICDLNRA